MITKFKIYEKYSNISFNTIDSIIVQNNVNMLIDFLDNNPNNINITSNNNYTLLNSALNVRNLEIFNLLLTYKPDVSKKSKNFKENILFKIIESGYDIDIIIKFLTSVLTYDSSIINDKNNVNGGRTPLDISVNFDFNITLTLLKFNPDWGDFLEYLPKKDVKIIIETYPKQYKEYLLEKDLEKFNI